MMAAGRSVAPFVMGLVLVAGTAVGQEGLPPPVTTDPGKAPEGARPGAGREESGSRDERAVEILRSAQEALAQAENVTLSARSEIVAESGLLSAFKLGAEGEVWARREEDGRWTRAMVGQADEIGTTRQLPFSIVKSDQRASWVDHEKQEIVHATGRQMKGQMWGSSELLGVDMVLGGVPYAKELSARTLESLGTETIGGTLCDVVRVDAGERSLPARWYIGASDGFPRRIVEELVEGAQRVYEFEKVALDTEIEASRFEIANPGTYVELNLPERTTAVNAPEGAPPVVSTPDSPIGEIYGSEVGDVGAPFTAEDIFGTKYNSEEYAGRPLVLYFWASWLPGTNAALDEMIRIHEHLGEKGTILTLALRERQPENASNAMLDAGGDEIPVITIAAGAAGAYNIAKVPGVVVLDAEGKIVYRNDDYEVGKSIDEVIGVVDGLVK